LHLLIGGTCSLQDFQDEELMVSASNIVGKCWGSAGEEYMYNKQLDGKTRHSRHLEMS
jgi:hypothetical protein